MKQIKDYMVARTPLKKVKKVQDRQSSLFPIEIQWDYIKHDSCPICFKRLYWNRLRTIIRCKSKLHSFVLTKKSYEDVVSGNRLRDWKEQDRLNKR